MVILGFLSPEIGRLATNHRMCPIHSANLLSAAPEFRCGSTLSSREGSNTCQSKPCCLHVKMCRVMLATVYRNTNCEIQAKALLPRTTANCGTRMGAEIGTHNQLASGKQGRSALGTRRGWKHSSACSRTEGIWTSQLCR